MMNASLIILNISETSGPGGVVRLINRKTAERALLKDFVGRVCDLSFAFISSRILLACVDEPGSLFVYEIKEDTENKIS